MNSSKRKLFIAYPWELTIKEMYDEILHSLSKEWDIRHGSDVTKIDRAAAEVEMFKNRNRQLYDLFVRGIEKSDIFIADLTNANANVMLELGIAIQLRKNILIVTSQDPNLLPFDIKGFKVDRYTSKEKLQEIVSHHLELFLKIKRQNFQTHFDECHFRFEDGNLLHSRPYTLPLPEKCKNLRLRAEYKFINVSRDDDWFGIHLRAQMPNIASSELLYVRNNGKLESVTFPGRRTPANGNLKELRTDFINRDGFRILELTLEENTLETETCDHVLNDGLIQIEAFGNIVLHAWAHDQDKASQLSIEYRNIEVINLDTISPI